ncbi:MAG: glycosyltransferase [Lacipirellulaceae bacterium]
MNSPELPLKVVHVTFGLDVGGLEKMLLDFARVNDPRKVSPVFVSLGDGGVVADEIRATGYPVVCLHRPTGFRPGLVGQLRRVLLNTRADVVHTHDARALLYGAPAARISGVRRVIHTQHGQGLGMSPRQQWMFASASRLVSRFVCVSDDAAAVARDYGVPADKTTTIHNGVNLDRFPSDPPTDDPLLADRPIVTIARLSPEKGVTTLLKAISIAADDEPNLRALIAGEGPCRKELEAETRRLRIDDRVEFLGHVRDIPGLLSGARLFVLPSDSEGVSLTLLEAMAARIAVVATSVGGTPEVVSDDETGVLVPPADPAAMSAAIVGLLRDGMRRERLAEAGRALVERQYDVRAVIDRYAELYERDLTPRAATRRDAPVAERAGL